MLAVVRIALSRPYTFVVMAMLIVIFGVAAAIKTPTDIFPNIGIPVVAVVWTYNGLPPDDMSGRVIYYYERTLSAQVNDIEHIEFSVARRLWRGQSVLPAQRQHQFSTGADHSGVANCAQAVASWHHSALRFEFQRLERSHPPAGVVQRHLVAGGDLRRRTELHPASIGDGRGSRGPLALWRQGSASPNRSRPGQVASLRAIVPGRGRSDCAAERHHPGWNPENR